MKGAPKKDSRNFPNFNKNRMREVKDVQKTVGRKTELTIDSDKDI